jgi:hypothetical protein
MSDLFKIDRTLELWKTSRIFICKTPGLSLWIALHNPRVSFREDADWERKALKAWTYPVDSKCRCRYCRYLRIFNEK